MRILADEAPGTHSTVNFCSSSLCNINYQSLISSGIAIVVTLLVFVFVVRGLRSDRPTKLQLIFELVLSYIRTLTRDTVDEESITLVAPLAATIAFYIFIANWLDFFPLKSPIEPANSDINQTAAMAIVVFLVVEWYAGKVSGWRGFFRRFTKPYDMATPVRIVFVPLNIIEELVKPVTLSLRLFGNIFAGVVMVFLLGQLFNAGSAFISPVVAAPVGLIGLILWKAFDVFFVGTIQAFIFMLLTVIYFGQAREGLHGLEEEHHGAPAHASA